MSEFGTCGTKPGIEIWRIEKLKPTAWPKAEYGKFFSGDAYIVLKTTAQPKGNGFLYDIFFWLGKDCSQDEQGVAAYKTVELDDSFGGKPVQHREVQGHESKEFLSMFPGGIVCPDGGIESGFRHVDPTAYKPRLFHLKGKRTVSVQQVELKSSSLNEGDVFILDAGLKLFQWNGKEANKYEKVKGLEMITKINSDERGNKAQVIFLDGTGADETDFWKILGDKGAVKSAKDVPSDDDVKEAVTLLYQIHEGQPHHIGSGPLDRKALDTNNTYIVDTGTAVYVWTGKASSKEARAQAMLMGQNYLASAGRPSWTPITRVSEGTEAPAFKALFKQWTEPKKVDFKDPAVKAKKAADFSALYNKQQQAAEKMLDDASGKLKIWRIDNFDKKELPADMYGQFYGGDSYILQYDYKSGNRDLSVIYFWQGNQSTNDEKGASALLTKQLADDLAAGPKGVKATQVRVVQNKEPDHFLSLFKGKMVVHAGGNASGFKNKQEAVAAAVSSGNSLYQVRGNRPINTRAIQVATHASSLNSGDCFVCVTPSKTFAWFGNGSTEEERKVAQNIAEVLSGGNEVVALNEGSESGEFWDALGGQGEYQTFGEITEGEAREPRLFCVSNSGGHLKVSEVPNFSQDDLLSDDVMILDAFNEVYVWIGKDSNQEEKEGALQAALDFVKNSPDGRDPDTAVYKVVQGGEPPSFTVHFFAWDPTKGTDFTDPLAAKLAAAKAAGSKGAGPAGAPAGKPAVAMERVKSVEDTRSFLDPATNKFTLAQIKAGQAGIDPKAKEQYLSDAEFQAVLGVPRAEFNAQAGWKRDAKKKEKGLF